MHEEVGESVIGLQSVAGHALVKGRVSETERHTSTQKFTVCSSPRTRGQLTLRVVHNFSSSWQKFLSSRIVVIER